MHNFDVQSKMIVKKSNIFYQFSEFANFLKSIEEDYSITRCCLIFSRLLIFELKLSNIRQCPTAEESRNIGILSLDKLASLVAFTSLTRQLHRFVREDLLHRTKVQLDPTQILLESFPI